MGMDAYVLQATFAFLFFPDCFYLVPRYPVSKLLQARMELDNEPSPSIESRRYDRKCT